MAKKYDDMPLTQGILIFSSILLAMVAVVALLGVFLGSWAGQDRSEAALLFVLSAGLAGLCAGLQMLIETFRAEDKTN